MLEPLVAGREGAIRLSEEVDADGAEFLRPARMALKAYLHREKACRSGRGEWRQKITCKRRDSFVVVGFEPSTVPALGQRLPAACKDGELVCRRLRCRLLK